MNTLYRAGRLVTGIVMMVLLVGCFVPVAVPVPIASGSDRSASFAEGATQTAVTQTVALSQEQGEQLTGQDRFMITIGAKIEDGVPGPGAGAIETPGAQDVYTFTAAPRQRVYFRMFEHSAGMEQIRWRLVDENNNEVFATCLGCSEPGVQMLITGGTYTMTVGGEDYPVTGLYRLQLFDVPPPDHFSIQIEAMIDDGVPGPGAGAIETPGAQDVYTFTAAPRQKVNFHLLQYSAGMEQIRWRLVDENENEVFATCLGCSEPGVQTLITGGAYTMTVGSGTVPATGLYALELGPE